MGLRQATAEPRKSPCGTPGPTISGRRDATAGAWGLGLLVGALAALALATGCSPDLPPWTAPEDTAAADTGADTATVSGADTVTDADTGPTGCTRDNECADPTWGPGTCLDGTCLSAGFVAIPEGSFVMGSSSSEVGHEANEIQHSVTLTHPFELQQMELTRGQWRAIMGPGHTPPPLGCTDDACPITSVNWWEAAAFANALSSARGLPPCYDLINCAGTIGVDYTCENVFFLGDGAGGSFYDCKGYRLPSEAEWEYAYRAGTTTPLYNGGSLTNADANDGQSDLDPIAWYGSAKDVPQHGGLKEANLWGLYDMAGNVWEFTSDGWVDFIFGEIQEDPAGVNGDTRRVSRGGAVGGQAQYCRAAQRGQIQADTREGITGLRLARTLPKDIVPCVAQTAACDGVDDNCDGLTDNAAALNLPPQAGGCPEDP